ncbi:MAG: hypothetical protein ACI4SG_08935 [Oligosphaeraceae bacterium]
MKNAANVMANVSVELPRPLNWSHEDISMGNEGIEDRSNEYPDLAKCACSGKGKNDGIL